jgi:phosphonate transport system substrate-binding protein
MELAISEGAGLRRREFLLAIAAAAGTRALPARAREAPVRFGLTPVFLDHHAGFLRIWQRYLESRLSRPLQFVQRGSYREISDMLRQDKLDFAWVCGYPFVRYRRQLRLLAVPLYLGKPLYQSYLIVPGADATTRSILDLRGKVFAFSDPDSNSGYLYANYRLAEANERPAGFFGKSFFTWAHRKVVEAVAAGLAQGGSVDGYVWDTLDKYSPELTRRTRVADRSPEFGFPPIVARASAPQEEFDAMRRALLGMAGDAEGRELLKRLNLEGFTPGAEELFDGIDRMMKAVDRFSNAPAA